MRTLFLNKKELADEDLLQRYQNKGDSESLGILYDRYLHLVYGLCLKYLKSRDASQDAAMDIYEILVNKLTNQEVTYFKSWLYMVCKNHCLMILRKTKKEISFEETFMESESSMHHYEEVSLEDDLSALEQCIDRLKDDQKHCVKLFYLEKKSYEHIASSCKQEVKKVKSYIQNGKRNLKICLEGKNVKR
ncbi:MAG: sigma-70 family RNA polymerase sigma factor [Cyclobacteriaceae bacterium]